MSLIAEFAVPAEEFALETALAAAPETRIEVERLATHSREWVMPFLWGQGGDAEAFEAALADDATVDDCEVLDRFDGATQYLVQWSEPVEALVDAMIDRHAVVRRARANDGEWLLEIRFSSADQLGAFRDHFEDGGFALRRKYRTTEPERGEFGLTPAQRETLVAAAESGYFSVPREATVEDLADELDVSANSVSQRLRRAHDALVRHALLVENAARGSVH